MKNGCESLHINVSGSRGCLKFNKISLLVYSSVFRPLVVNTCIIFAKKNKLIYKRNNTSGTLDIVLFILKKLRSRGNVLFILKNKNKT